jgi:cysteinyl-tRNA synthetase
MSKRDGTFFTVRDLIGERGIAPAVLRYALLSNHYRQPMNFTFDLLAQARASIERLQGLYDRLRDVEGASGAVRADVQSPPETARARFEDALADDLKMPNALAEVFGLVRELNGLPELGPADAAAARALLDSFDEVLDVLDRSERSGLITTAHIAALLAVGGASEDTVEGLVALRQAARAARD